LGKKPFFSDRNEVSLSKRWALIQAECSKFQGSFETVTARKISGCSAVDMVYLFLYCQCALEICGHVSLSFHTCRLFTLWSISKMPMITRLSH
jgi:hypothetical protein